MSAWRQLGLAAAMLAGCGPQDPGRSELGLEQALSPRVSAQATSLPAPVVAAAATFASGRAYVGGGLESRWPGAPSAKVCTQTLHALDPDTGELSPAGTLPAPVRGHLLAASPNGALVVGMGYCGAATEVETDVYSLTVDGATRLGAMPVGAFYPVGALVPAADGGTALLAAGGYGCGPERDQIQLLNLDSRGARELAIRLPRPRPLGAGAASGDALYMFGGSSLGEPLDQAATNPFTDEVVAVTLGPEQATVVAHLPEPLAGSCAVTTSDDTVLLFGGARYVAGESGLVLEPTDTILHFDPSTSEVTVAAERLPEPRVGLACAVGPDDRVYLFGGSGPGFVPTSTVLQYEPTSWLLAQQQQNASALKLRVGMGCDAAPGPAGSAALLVAALLAWGSQRRWASTRPRG